MPKIALKRFWRQSPRKLHRAGAVVDVDESTAERLIRLGAATAVDKPAAAVDADPQPTAADDVTAVDDAPAAPAADDDDEPVEETSSDEDDAPKKPRKVDNLATWQAYHKAMGHDPKGMKLEELKAFWA